MFGSYRVLLGTYRDVFGLYRGVFGPYMVLFNLYRAVFGLYRVLFGYTGSSLAHTGLCLASYRSVNNLSAWRTDPNNTEITRLEMAMYFWCCSGFDGVKFENTSGYS